MLDIVRQNKMAGIRQIYRGLTYTVLREAVGLGLYYGGFHITLMNLFKEGKRQEASFSSQVGSALLAGLVYNLWSYPIDTFKTNLQSGRCKEAVSWCPRSFGGTVATGKAWWSIC